MIQSDDALLEFAILTAREAGERLRRAHGTIKRAEVGYKGWRNLVTELDLEVEALVGRRIEEAWPEHGILAEEGTRKDASTASRWVIDPLDGTTNYVHRHPMYCVSIAFEDEHGPRVGAIFAPHLDELFTAVRGGGAWLNREIPISVSDEDDLSHALLSSGFGYTAEGSDPNLANWARLSRVSRGLRRCGAAALDLAYVADGRYDGFWELNLSPWDVAAGALLVAEAGGRVTGCAGDPDYRGGRSILASNGRLHETILGHITCS